MRDASGGVLDDQEDDAKQGCLSIVRTCGGQRVVGGGCIPKRASSGAHVAGHAVAKSFLCYSFPSIEDDAHTGMSESSKAPLEVGQKNEV